MFLLFAQSTSCCCAPGQCCGTREHWSAVSQLFFINARWSQIGLYIFYFFLKPGHYNFEFNHVFPFFWLRFYLCLLNVGHRPALYLWYFVICLLYIDVKENMLFCVNFQEYFLFMESFNLYPKPKLYQYFISNLSHGDCSCNLCIKKMLGSHLNSWMIELDQLHSNTFSFLQLIMSTCEMFTISVKAVAFDLFWIASLSTHWLFKPFNVLKLFQMIANYWCIFRAKLIPQRKRPYTPNWSLMAVNPMAALLLNKAAFIYIKIKWSVHGHLRIHIFSVDIQVISTVAMNYNQSEACFSSSTATLFNYCLSDCMLFLMCKIDLILWFYNTWHYFTLQLDAFADLSRLLYSGDSSPHYFQGTFL